MAAGNDPAAGVFSCYVPCVLEAEIDPDARTAVVAIIVRVVSAVVVGPIPTPAMVVAMAVPAMTVVVPMPLPPALSDFLDRAFPGSRRFRNPGPCGSHGLSRSCCGEDRCASSQQGHGNQFAHGCFPFSGWSRLTNEAYYEFHCLSDHLNWLVVRRSETIRAPTFFLAPQQIDAVAPRRKRLTLFVSQRRHRRGGS